MGKIFICKTLHFLSITAEHTQDDEKTKGAQK
jgi:hypothetical protein